MSKFIQLKNKIDELLKTIDDLKIQNELKKLKIFTDSQETYYNSIPVSIKTGNSLNNIVGRIEKKIKNLEELSKPKDIYYYEEDNTETKVITAAYLSYTNTDIEKEKLDLQKQNEKLQKEIDGLKSSISSCENTNKKCEENLTNKTTELKEQSTEISDLKSKLDIAEKEKAKLETELKDLRNIKNENERNLETTRESLQKVNEQIELEKTKNQELNDSNLNNLDLLDKYDEKCGKLSNDIILYMDTIKKITAIISILENTISGTEKKIFDLKTELDILVEKNEILVESNNECIKKNEELNKELNDKTRQLESIIKELNDTNIYILNHEEKLKEINALLTENNINSKIVKETLDTSQKDLESEKEKNISNQKIIDEKTKFLKLKGDLNEKLITEKRDCVKKIQELKTNIEKLTIEKIKLNKRIKELEDKANMPINDRFWKELLNLEKSFIEINPTSEKYNTEIHDIFSNTEKLKKTAIIRYNNDEEFKKKIDNLEINIINKLLLFLENEYNKINILPVTKTNGKFLVSYLDTLLEKNETMFKIINSDDEFRDRVNTLKTNIQDLTNNTREATGGNQNSCVIS